jgi:hypothetical protein
MAVMLEARQPVTEVLFRTRCGSEDLLAKCLQCLALGSGNLLQVLVGVRWLLWNVTHFGDGWCELKSSSVQLIPKDGQG